MKWRQVKEMFETLNEKQLDEEVIVSDDDRPGEFLAELYLEASDEEYQPILCISLTKRAPQIAYELITVLP